MGREWQLGTSQLDYNLPERFDLSYITPEGNEARPVMIHRALLGSMERFIGPLIEHFAGDFPLWLAPVQAVIIPISERSHEYGLEVLDLLKAQKIRAELDLRPERMQAKIRDAELAKVPLILVAGEREAQNHTLAVRERHGQDRGSLPLGDFLAEIQARIARRSLD